MHRHPTTSHFAPLVAPSLARAALVALALVAACGGDTETRLRQPEQQPPAPIGDVQQPDIHTPDDTVVTTPLEDDAPCTADEQCSSKYCGWRSDGRRCAPTCDGTPCADGLRCAAVVPGGAGHCVDPWVSQCAPCEDDASCGDGTGRCVALGPASGRICAVACEDTGVPCPAGATCSDGFCMPDAPEACLCSAFAVGTTASTPCTRANALGACPGTRTCEVIGEPPTACDAPTPAAETCNGKDDDCDASTDERPLSESCGAYGCGGAEGCLVACTEPGDCAPGNACDTSTGVCAPDGSAGSLCDGAEACDSGICTNGHCCPDQPGDGDAVLCCAEDLDCAALDGDANCAEAGVNGCAGTRRVGRCVASICTAVEIDDVSACEGAVCDASSCADAMTLNKARTCQVDGTCGASETTPCRDGNPCTTDACAEAACAYTPRDGESGTACYTFDAATRGRGVCSDGVFACEAGAIGACVGEVGPRAEVCDGVDDDCDGVTDNGTEAECFPYVCRGQPGCAETCSTDADCGAGNFCDVSGACVPTGDNGSMCNADGQCRSGHCGGGVCCDEGLCCNDGADCDPLDGNACEDATIDGCIGFRANGRCGGNFACTADLTPDPSVCAGRACQDAPACLVDGRLGDDWTCTNSGACEPATVVDCSPYRCGAGRCLTNCQGNEDCMVGSACRDGVCAPLADGSACTADAQCASAHCSQGVCCRGDLCCRSAADCSSLDGPSSCVDANQCLGQALRGSCRADFICESRRVDVADACENQRCGAVSCVNLAGGSTVREGVNRPVCDANGACVEAVRDCRQFETGAYCDNTDRTIYATCSNCSENRLTCVAPGFGCRCE